jgi:predicted ferric reductase
MAIPAPYPAATRPRPPGPPPAASAPARRAARLTHPSLILAVIGAGAVAVIALWWHDTPAISGTGDLLTGAGRVLGLLAGYGFVVLVTLMARLPPLERGIGADRLARWHAMGGRYVITLLTGHAVAIIWGYAVTAHQAVTTEAGTLMISYPDVLMATVAGFLLLGIGLISARAARRRLAYETWYYAHLYTYIAIALAFSHQFADGASFTASLPARAAWSALYLTVGALIAWYRVLTPLRKAARHHFTVMGVREEAPGIVSVYITGRHLTELQAQPGQFFRWRFLTRQLWWQSHPYSLSAIPRGDLMRITVKACGDHSQAMTRLRPGTRVIAEGPYGAFTPASSRRGVLLIAGGVGITPIRAMFAALPGGVSLLSGGTTLLSGGTTLLYRASHPRDIVFRRELDTIAADRDATIHYLIGSRDQLGTDPLNPRHLKALVPGLHRHEAYICGPPGMTQAAITALRAAGIPRRRIHHESFDF